VTYITAQFRIGPQSCCGCSGGQEWCRFLDTTLEAAFDALDFGSEERLVDQKPYTVEPRSTVAEGAG